jgi:hypothetical protein
MSRGGARQKAGRYYAHTRFGHGERLEFRVPWAKTEGEAIARSHVMGEIAEALCSAGRRDLVRATVRRIAEAPTAKRLDTVRKAAATLIDGALKAGHASDITFKQWGERYTSGELSRLWPDHVKAKDWSDDISRLKKYVYPLVKDVPVTAFTFDHAGRVLAELPPGRDANRRHVAQIVGRLLHLAVFPGKLIASTPLPRGWLPKIKDRRHYSCLFPREEALVIGHGAASTAWRLFCGVLNREGMRLTELLDAAWWQFGLVEGTFTATKTKTGDPRMWALRPDVAEAMRIWRLACTHERPFAYVEALVSERSKIAEFFRRSIRAAGVNRPELFDTTEHTGRLRAHDMRATFVTVSIAEGKSEAWIRDRTGHRSTLMIDRYRRTARQFTELELGSLVDLVEAMGWRKPGGISVVSDPEIPAKPSKVHGEGLEPSRLSAAEPKSDGGPRGVAEQLNLPVESDVSPRSDRGFHQSSTTLSATSGTVGGGTGARPKRTIRPGPARARPAARVVHIRRVANGGFVVVDGLEEELPTVGPDRPGSPATGRSGPTPVHRDVKPANAVLEERRPPREPIEVDGREVYAEEELAELGAVFPLIRGGR